MRFEFSTVPAPSSEAMVVRVFSLVAGFFVYVAVLLCFVQVPPQFNKPLLASGFAVIGAICAVIALTVAKFAGWQRTLGAILIGASLMGAAAVAAITVVRSSNALTAAPHAKQLDGFTDYRTGTIATIVTLAIGAILF